MSYSSFPTHTHILWRYTNNEQATDATEDEHDHKWRRQTKGNNGAKMFGHAVLIRWGYIYSIRSGTHMHKHAVMWRWLNESKPLESLILQACLVSTPGKQDKNLGFDSCSSGKWCYASESNGGMYKTLAGSRERISGWGAGFEDSFDWSIYWCKFTWVWCV